MDFDVDLTGRRVGRYEIRSLLGSGGMGAVYRAYDSNLDRTVAVKILPPHLVTDAERVRRFVQEAKSASALNHPHVVSIYEIGEDDSLHYIAMELVEGTTLRARVSGGALELKRALVVGEQIAEAIGAAHEAGVVHRDLKPENIIIANSGYVKVLDFGLAKLRRETSAIGGDAATEVKSTEPGRILGTVGYMSPEQAEGKSVDHRSDIFSLGCILYETVSGRSPFRGRTSVETLNNIVHGPTPPLGGPAELQRIVNKTLAKDPDERYQSAKDLAVDLKRLLRELDSNATLTTDYGVKPQRTIPWRWIALAAAALIAIIAAVLLLRPSKDAAPQAPLTIKRITSTGLVPGAAVSPDGKYVAYVHSEQNKQSLILRQLATGQDLQLVAPAVVGYWGHAFAPNGAAIYYAIKSRANPKGTLYSIAILGGTPRKILDGIDSPVSFSPDGKRMTYVRSEPAFGESSLVVSNADGSDVRILAKRRPPEFFYPNFFAGPAWSPDGKQIAVTEATRREHTDQTASLIGVDVASGATRTIAGGWDAAQQVAWLPDGNELILIGARQGRTTQVWSVEASSGNARPVTNDLLEYRMPTLTADGSTLVAVAMDRDADLWRLPLDGGEPPKKIRGGKGLGLVGLDVGPDGSIAHTSQDGGTVDLWITGADGTSAWQLTNDRAFENNPSFTPDGKTIVFGVSRGAPSVRRSRPSVRRSRRTERASPFTAGRRASPTASASFRWPAERRRKRSKRRDRTITA